MLFISIGQVLKPLEVKTKFYNAGHLKGMNDDVIFLEAQVQNITTSPLCIQHVKLDATQYYNMRSLNFLPGKKVRAREAHNFCWVRALVLFLEI